MSESLSNTVAPPETECDWTTEAENGTDQIGTDIGAATDIYHEEV